jgi:hypothetical protein
MIEEWRVVKVTIFDPDKRKCHGYWLTVVPRLSVEGSEPSGSVYRQ